MKLKILAIAILAILLPCVSWAAPGITVSASGVSILGTNTPISISVTLIDPNSTGNLRIVGTGVIPIFQASSVTPGATTLVGPIYGNDVIVDGFGNANSTYYKVQVFTVTNGIIASTPSLQNFYAFQGAGTVDLATATPLAPSFMTGPGGSVVIPGNLTVNGGLTFTGPLVAGSVTSNNINSVLYVGGLLSAVDIGAQINAAYAALPASGGKIVVLPSSTAYAYSTPIVFATPGKYVLLEGTGVGNSTSGSAVTNLPSGTVLQFTPTSGNAITMDYVPVGAAAWNGRHGINNLTLVGNQLTLYGGTIATPNTTTSMGIRVGDTNWGCLGASFYNLDLRGFSTNFYVQNQISWGLSFYNLTSMFSKHGLHIQDIEQVTIINPKLFYNLTALETSSEITIVGGSIDQNGGEFSGSTNQTSTQSPAFVDISGAAFTPDNTVTGTHFEQGQAGFLNPMQLVNFSNGISRIYGGSGNDNLATGAAQVWFTAAFSIVDGFNAFSAGRTGVVNEGTTQSISRVLNMGTLSGGNPVLASSGGANASDYGMQVNAVPTATFGGKVNSVGGFFIAGVTSWVRGAGVPSAGTCTASTGGSLYSRTDGTPTTTLYVCDNSTHVWTAK